MNGRWSHRFDGHLRLMGVDVPLRNGPQRIAFAIIIAGLITVPLIPFIESPTSIWGRWVGAGFVASVVAANVLLGCFVRRLARATAEPAAMNSDWLLRSNREVRFRARNHRRSECAPPGSKARGINGAHCGHCRWNCADDDLPFRHSFTSRCRSRMGMGELEGIYASVLMLMALTVGMAISWVGRLRRPLRLVSQSPGAIACLLASIVLIAVTYHLAVNYATENIARDRQNVFWRINYWRAIIGPTPTAIGLLILSGWNLVAIGGAGHPSRRGSTAAAGCWGCVGSRGP